MDSGDGLVNEFDEFFNAVYSSEIALLKSNFPKIRSLNIKYTDLEKWNSDIADLLLKNPDKVVTAAKEALEMHGFDKTYDYEVHVRFHELPDFNLLVQDLGAAHIDKLIRVEGILTKRYETKPKVKMALFKCKNCGANYKVIMTKQTQPMRMCEVCKKKVDFSEEESYFVDVQFAEMQELLERLRGGAPASHIQLMMEDDLVNYINPGEEVTITGILRIKPPIKTQNDNIYLKYLDVLKIDKSKKDFEQLEITEEEKEKIKELGKNPEILNKIARSFAPGIFGNDKIKEAITLQLFGGTPNKTLPGGAPIRDDMHLLLIGDPGAAKSRLLKYVHSVSPKSVYVSGKSVSGVGLCVDKNSLVILENKGICKIKDYIEENFKNQKLIENANSEKHKVKILAVNEKLNCAFVETNNIWKIKPSEYLYKIETRRGKYIKITPQTPLLVYRNNKVEWIKSSELNEKDLIATSKQISSFKKQKVSLISLIKSENVRINSPVSILFNKISKKLIEMYGNLTEASKEIGFRREQLYEWKNLKYSNGIKLKDLRKLIEITKIDEKELEQFNEFFVRYGKNIRIPIYLNENVSYLAGLIAGDGDISSTDSVGIRLHSIDEKLLLKAKQILKNEFNLESKISKSKDRVPCLRFSSIILRDIFYALGIPSGEKSHKIDITNTLLLSGEKNITAFLRGLYDSDGCVTIPNNGSESIGFSTCSKILAQKMQLILEMYGIIAKLRVRERNKEYVTNKRKIKSKKVQYHLEIRGVENFKLFKDKINFDKEDKRKKLNLICKDIKSNPNVGILPKRIYKEFYWDEINKITKIKCNDEWVYDFTVNDGHSFFANGILVHNTASAEKDNMSDGGWVLKAGALVLASGGLAAIDEFDKIDDSDRASLHEAMESQSYHYNTNITFADGSIKKIGDFVEENLNSSKIKGKDCFVQNGNFGNLLTLENGKVITAKITQISKHKVNEKLFKIKLDNGQDLIVTAKHPFLKPHLSNLYNEVDAETLKKNDYILSPISISISENKINPFLARFLGYHITDGSYELNRGKKNGVNFTNKNIELIEDYTKLSKQLFDKEPYIYKRKNGMYYARIISVDVMKKLIGIDKTLLEKGNVKKIPLCIMNSDKKATIEFLKACFEGDGGFKNGTVYFVSSNEIVIEQLQFLLLRFGIFSRKKIDGNVFRLYINGENAKNFCNSIGFISHKKNEKVISYYKIKREKREYTEIIPWCFTRDIVHLIKKYKIVYNSDIQKYKSYNWHKSHLLKYVSKIIDKNKKIKTEIKKIDKYSFEDLINLRRELNISQSDLDFKYRSNISYWERNKINFDNYKLLIKKYFEKLLFETDNSVSNLNKILDFRYVKILKIEEYYDTNEWVYDIAVKPNSLFISKGVVLHNSISVAKAGIVATFKSKTAIIAAANPKYGRFNKNMYPADQFNIPSTLLSRFDLIFPMYDDIDEERDRMLATHILNSHANIDNPTLNQEDLMDVDFIRKYVSYARKYVFPRLTPEAMTLISDYYIEMRILGKRQGSIPITARQIEGLVRMAEASAKARLCEHVEAQDAERSIRLFDYALRLIAMDATTGKLDIDIIATGQPKARREKFMTIMNIIKELSEKVDLIGLDEIKSKAREYEIEENEIQSIVEKLREKGEIYSPKNGFYKITDRK